MRREGEWTYRVVSGYPCVWQCCAVDPSKRPTADVLLSHDFLLKNTPSAVPLAFEQLLPPRPVDMNAIPGPKRKIIKTFIREAVSGKLSKLDHIAEDGPMLSAATHNPYFKDRCMGGQLGWLGWLLDAYLTTVSDWLLGSWWHAGTCSAWRSSCACPWARCRRSSTRRSTSS